MFRVAFGEGTKHTMPCDSALEPQLATIIDGHVAASYKLIGISKLSTSQIPGKPTIAKINNLMSVHQNTTIFYSDLAETPTSKQSYYIHG